jgi:hypothetical protein
LARELQHARKCGLDLFLEVAAVRELASKLDEDGNLELDTLTTSAF